MDCEFSMLETIRNIDLRVERTCHTVQEVKPVVVIEMYVVNGWEPYTDAGYSMNSFWKPLPTRPINSSILMAT